MRIILLSLAIFILFAHISMAAPTITGYAPSSPVQNKGGDSRTFNLTFSEPVNVTWYLNGSIKKTETDVLNSSYTNTSAGIGAWNVTASGTNVNGTASQEWVWEVSVSTIWDETENVINSVIGIFTLLISHFDALIIFAAQLGTLFILICLIMASFWIASLLFH